MLARDLLILAVNDNTLEFNGKLMRHIMKHVENYYMKLPVVIWNKLYKPGLSFAGIRSVRRNKRRFDELQKTRKASVYQRRNTIISLLSTKLIR